MTHVAGSLPNASPAPLWAVVIARRTQSVAISRDVLLLQVVNVRLVIREIQVSLGLRSEIAARDCITRLQRAIARRSRGVQFLYTGRIFRQLPHVAECLFLIDWHFLSGRFCGIVRRGPADGLRGAVRGVVRGAVRRGLGGRTGVRPVDAPLLL